MDSEPDDVTSAEQNNLNFIYLIYYWNCTTTTTHPFNGPFSGTTLVSQYQKGKTNLDFTEARDSEWQWNQLGHMQVCISLQTDNHNNTPPLSFLQAGCPSCRPTNSVKALKGYHYHHMPKNNNEISVFFASHKKHSTVQRGTSSSAFKNYRQGKRTMLTCRPSMMLR